MCGHLSLSITAEILNYYNNFFTYFRKHQLLVEIYYFVRKR
jgi:hypothetical protein